MDKIGVKTSGLIAVQPIGKISNFEASVIGNVEEVYSKVSHELKEKLKENVGRQFYGVTKDVQYKKMDHGTLVLFSYDKKIIASAQVVGFIESPDLSELAWGEASYRFIYFLDNVQEMDLETTELYNAVYEKEGHFQGFVVLDEKNSRRAETIL